MDLFLRGPYERGGRSQNEVQHIGGGIRGTVGAQIAGDMGDIIAGGNNGRFDHACSISLAESDGRKQGVAEALTADGAALQATLIHINIYRFSGTAITNQSIVATVNFA